MIVNSILYIVLLFSFRFRFRVASRDFSSFVRLSYFISTGKKKIFNFILCFLFSFFLVTCFFVLFIFSFSVFCFFCDFYKICLTFLLSSPILTDNDKLSIIFFILLVVLFI
uniref:Uncharacterized protein n=1 Tax=Cacopsylla melanoneura TaxID=428564 RepID=A0A8D9DV46_9HEMI